MLSAADAQGLAEARLVEATLLLDQGRYAGAYYLAGYAVELALKAVIARQFLAGVIPDKKFVQNIHQHDPARLLGLAGLAADLDAADPSLQANWLVAAQWSEEARYEMVDQFKAIELIRAIDDPVSGVFRWLKSRW